MRRSLARGAMLVVLALAPERTGVAAVGGSIAVGAGGAGCPTRAQVVAALETRLSGVTEKTPSAAPGLRLDVARAGGAPKLSLRLRDERGGVLLQRELALDDKAAGASPPAEACEGLAETVALVVVRFLREIGYRLPTEAPPPPPVAVAATAPPPSPAPGTAGLLGVAGAGRFGLGTGGGNARAEISVALDVHAARVAVALGAGVTSESVVAVPGAAGGELRLRAFPLRLALGVPLSVGAGAIVPTAGVGLDVLSFRASGLTDAQSGARLEPALELGVAYLYVGRQLYGRLHLGGGLSLGPRDFDAGLPEPVFRTPDAYLRALLEVGLVLWKNPSRPSL